MVNIVTPEGSPMSATDYFYANQNHHDDLNDLDDLDEFDYYFTHGHEHEQFNYFMDIHGSFDVPGSFDGPDPFDDLLDGPLEDADNMEPISADYNHNNNTNVTNVIEYNNDEIDDNYIPLTPPPLTRQVNVPNDFRYYNQFVDNNGQPISQQ